MSAPTHKKYGLVKKFPVKISEAMACDCNPIIDKYNSLFPTKQ